MEVFESVLAYLTPVNNATDLIKPDSESCMLTQGLDSLSVVRKFIEPKIVSSTILAMFPL